MGERPYDEVLQAVLAAVRRGEREGKLLSSSDLRELYAWMDDTDLLNTLDDFYSSGYLVGRPRRGSHPHLHEYTDLRVGSRVKKEFPHLLS